MNRSSLPRSLPQPGHRYDVAVIGAGLAGTELAWRLAQGGQDVLLVSQALDHLGNLFQPGLRDIHFPAGSLFAQVAQPLPPDVELWAFHRLLKAEVERTAGIHLLQSTVTGLAEEDGLVKLRSWEGPILRAERAVLAVGSFLKGRLLIGEVLEEAGRLSEVAYDFLADDLLAQGLRFIGQEQMAVGLAGQPPYSVRFLTFAADELQGFQLRRFEEIYALGRCLPGEHSYHSVLQDASALARQLLKEAQP